jgi:hypothetical protein
MDPSKRVSPPPITPIGPIPLPGPQDPRGHNPFGGGQPPVPPIPPAGMGRFGDLMHRARAISSGRVQDPTMPSAQKRHDIRGILQGAGLPTHPQGGFASDPVQVAMQVLALLGGLPAASGPMAGGPMTPFRPSY